MADWEHNEIYHDWTIDLKMPRGGIRGSITFRNRRCGDYAVWGTVESWVDGRHMMEAFTYDDPNTAMGDLMMKIINLLNDLINRLVTT